jgi:hypothetical protein
MGTIPLVASTIRPIEQPDVLSNFQRLTQLRGEQQNQQQRAQMAPLQLQQAQQQVQAGQMQNEQMQQAQKDQQASTAAFQSWDGKSYDDLAKGIVANGGSYGAAKAAQDAGLKLRSDVAKLQGEALDMQIKRNGLIAPVLASVMDVPDEQLAQTVAAKAQELGQQGLFDPQHVQQALQLAQSGDPAKIRAGVAASLKGVTAYSSILDQQKQQETARHDKAMESKLTEGEMQQADWLKKNPGKGPSDYVAWKAKQSPTALMMGNVSLTPEGMELAANNYRLTGQLPSNLSRDPKLTGNIINQAGMMDKQAGGEGIAVNKTLLAANTTSLKNLQKNFDQVSAFESTANKNLDLYLEKLNQIPDLGAKFANVPMRLINDRMIGTANYQAMKAAQQTAAAETAKVLSSANASGVLSDTQKKEAEDMLSGNLSYAAAQKVVATLKQDFANRHQSYQMQIKDIQDRVRSTGNANSGGQQSSGSDGSSDAFSQFGGKAH